MPKIIKYNFNEINKNPILYVHEKELTEKQIQSILTSASKSYYGTSNELLSDASFDALKEYFEEKYPNNPFHKKIGSF